MTNIMVISDTHKLITYLVNNIDCNVGSSNYKEFVNDTETLGPTEKERVKENETIG